MQPGGLPSIALLFLVSSLVSFVSLQVSFLLCRSLPGMAERAAAARAAKFCLFAL